MYNPFNSPIQADRRFDMQIKADKLRLLYQQSFPAVFLSLASALLLAIILWPHTEQTVLLGWLGALIIASAARVVLFMTYRHSPPEGMSILSWERPYLTTLMLSSLIWGLGGVWIMPQDSLLYESVVLYFLMGMSAGAVSAYSAIRSFAIAAIAAVLLPATIWMLTRGELTPVAMGLAAFLLLYSALRATKVLSTSAHVHRSHRPRRMWGG